MAIIGKESFVHKVLTNLSSVQLAALASKIDNPGQIESFHLKLSTFTNGVKYVNFYPDEISGISYKGFLCKTDDYCAVFAFFNCAESMTAFEIDVTNRTAKIRYQNLSAEELRREIDDIEEASPGGKDAWVEMMKTKLTYDEQGNQLVASKKLHIEGYASDNFGLIVDEKSKFNKNVEIYGNVHIINTSAETPQQYYAVDMQQLNVNEIHCYDAGGTTPTVTFKNCMVEISGEHADIGANLSNKIATSLIGVFPDIKDTVPASSSAVGHKGDIAFDSTYLYICIAGDGTSSTTSTWKRIAWDSWN